MFDFAEATKSMTAAEILNYYRNLYYTEPQVTERGIVANAINELLPNVAPVVHGEWETDKEDIEWGNSLKKKYCSVCGKRPWYDRTDREFVLTSFCPNCGAKMDGGKKNG